MKWSSFLSQASSFEKAVEEASQAVTSTLYGTSSGASTHREVDFAAVFVSENWRSSYGDLLKVLKPHLSAKLLIGCSGGGVIGGAEEAEHKQAVSITAALLPEVKFFPFHLEAKHLPDLDASPQVWEKLIGVPASENPQFILLVDPFSFRIDEFVEGLDYAFPKSPKIGGLASGASSPGDNALYLNGKYHNSGVVGVAMTGNISLETVVAQGCRPIGNSMVITACENNLLLSLNRERPMKVLQDLFQTLSHRDQELMTHSLFLGVVTDPRKKEFNPGDFLIRNLIGADNERGILAIGAMLRVGQTVQFHLRDAETSAENLQFMLDQYRKASVGHANPQGALLFSCLGRGEFLYGIRNHDSRLFMETLGHIPLGGFFCNGEIGPINGSTYLHGYTSCFGLFKPTREKRV